MRFLIPAVSATLFITALIGTGILFFLIFRPSRTGWSDRDTALLSFPGGDITAEIASSTIKKYRGLSGHAPLAENTGMLFIFDNPGTYPFVMRGMAFPLDFVWLNANRIVAGIDKNIPPPAQGENAQVVRPKEPITMVLEIPAGTIARLNIQIGDSVTITRE